MGRSCDEYRSSMTPDEVIELLQDCPPGPWPSGWGHQGNVMEAHRRMANKWIEDYEPSGVYWPRDRGIVICGGGLRYIPSIWVHLHLIRRMKCTLPIQIWYMGDHEIDPYLRRVFGQLGAECVDALKHPAAREFRILCGWECKLFSTWHAPFRKVLFLDADSCPTINPEFLFDCRTFENNGAIFWPDYPEWKLKPDVWEIFGIDWMANADMANNEPALESGQFMVDKTRCEKEFRLAMWYAEHSDFTFNHVYGDKETFHLAWRKLQSQYGSARLPGWNQHTICQWNPEKSDQVLFQHRVQDKWRFSGTNRFVDTLANEAEGFQLIRELQAVWSGVLWTNPFPNEQERKVMAEIYSQRWNYARVGYDERPMRFAPNNKISQGAAECEECWWVNTVDDEPVLTISRLDRPTCHLRKEGDAWVGQWLENEKMPIRLSKHE